MGKLGGQTKQIGRYDEGTGGEMRVIMYYIAGRIAVEKTQRVQAE